MVGEVARTTEPVPVTAVMPVPLIWKMLPVPAVLNVLLVKVSVVARPTYVSVPWNVSVVPSVPARVRELLAVNVLPSAMVRVEPVAGVVSVSLLIEVAEATPRVGVTRVGEVERTTSPVPVHVKREEVAMAVGTAEAPVLFAQSELAAIAAKLIVEAVPPTCAPRVPELARPVPTAREDVATDCTAPVPAPYSNCDDENVFWPVPPEATRSGVMSVSAPAEEKVLVAVAPKYALLKTESWEVEALVNASNEGSENVGFPPVPSPLAIVIWLAVPVSVRAVTPELPFDESIPIKFWKVTAALAIKLVVEAVVAVTIVVDAYGAVSRATEGRVREPLVENVLVAVAPKYA